MIDISLKNLSGIYCIKSISNKKMYIGSATCLYTRAHVHFCTLKNGTHKNRHLQRIYNKHTKSDLHFEVIEFCHKDDLTKREQYYIDLLRPEINICLSAINTYGFRFSEEQKAQMSRTRKGKNTSGMTGRKHREETIIILKEKAKARGISKELREASVLANTGRKHSKDHRIKCALSQRKITPEKAQYIRQERAKGVYQYVIAKHLGVSQRVIVRVEKRIGIYSHQDYD